MGVVLSVWKKAFKGANKPEAHQAQLTHVPVDLRLLHSFRVAKLERTAAGHFLCTGRADTFLCKGDCLALTMKAVRQPSPPSTFVCSLSPSSTAICNALEKLDLPQVEAMADSAGQKLLSAAANKAAARQKAKVTKITKALVDPKDPKDAKPPKPAKPTVVEEMHRLLRLDMPLGNLAGSQEYLLIYLIYLSILSIIILIIILIIIILIFLYNIRYIRYISYFDYTDCTDYTASFASKNFGLQNLTVSVNSVRHFKWSRQDSQATVSTMSTQESVRRQACG